MKRTRLLALIALSGFVLGTTCPPTTNNNNNNNSARNVQVDSEATARPADDPAICCEGSNVYVAWAERRTGPGYDILFARSADGGATWTESPTLLNRDAPGISDSRTPIICCDGLNIYVVWLNGPDPVHMYFNSSADGGVTWRDFAVRISGSTPTGFHSFPRICCMGTNVYVSWSDDRAGAGRPDMFFNRSTDGGTTWLQDDTRISSWAPGTDVGLTQHEMCCDGQNVYVSWSDRRNGDYDMWLTRSTDGGEMWPVMETRVDNGATGVNSGAASYEHSLCCSGQNIYVAWTDNRNAGGNAGADVYLNASSDGGASFGGTDSRVNATDLASAGLLARNPNLCCTGTTVHATWRDNRAGANLQVFYRRSTDGGTTFLVSDRRVDTGTGSVTSRPWICCDQTNVHITWYSSVGDQFINMSTDSGASWLTTEANLDSNMPAAGTVTGGANYPMICCNGATPYVVWRDDRNGTAGQTFDIFFGRPN
ncbi:MAG: glycoside hydrolase [Phycisphaerales bacterium]|nr:glycoside hydrolase [Phycisphaerales bacterium]